jgi:hypothetical protein
MPRPGTISSSSACTTTPKQKDVQRNCKQSWRNGTPRERARQLFEDAHHPGTIKIRRLGRLCCPERKPFTSKWRGSPIKTTTPVGTYWGTIVRGRIAASCCASSRKHPRYVRKLRRHQHGGVRAERRETESDRLVSRQIANPAWVRPRKVGELGRRKLQRRARQLERRFAGRTGGGETGSVACVEARHPQRPIKRSRRLGRCSAQETIRRRRACSTRFRRLRSDC